MAAASFFVFKARFLATKFLAVLALEPSWPPVMSMREDVLQSIVHRWINDLKATDQLESKLGSFTSSLELIQSKDCPEVQLLAVWEMAAFMKQDPSKNMQLN